MGRCISMVYKITCKFWCFWQAVGDPKEIKNCSCRRSAVKYRHSYGRCGIYVVIHGDNDTHAAFFLTRTYQLLERLCQESIEDVLEEEKLLLIPLQ